MQAGILMVGVDVAKKDFVAALFHGARKRRLCWEHSPMKLRATKPCGPIEETKLFVTSWAATQVQLVIEATGGYEAALVAHAYAQDWLVSMPNAKQIRDWAKGVSYRGKSDRIDAQILAHYGAEQPPKPGDHNWPGRIRANWIAC